MAELKLEINRTVTDRTLVVGRAMVTPMVSEDYWLFRVQLRGEQAILGFPKFGTIGIGFAQEEDWNSNLPYTSDAEAIHDHIARNKGDDAISREDVLAAIRLVQAAAAEYMKERR